MTRPDRGPDTRPQPAVPPLPLTPEQTRTAVRGVAGVLAVRSALALVGAVACVVGAVLLYRHAISPHTFPAFVAGTDSTTIDRWSGPWLAGAGGVLLLGCLLATQGVVDLVRRIRLTPAGRTPAMAAPQPTSGGPGRPQFDPAPRFDHATQFGRPLDRPVQFDGPAQVDRPEQFDPAGPPRRPAPPTGPAGT
ncbi:hypothetical protein [Nakamurella alba]|uniref:hypothetical protein n=1 Tax=Nakamurella alba TaxID=2665158 RepID=UPI001E322A5A|nr:hypothetical protein [Nakamurella alba]